MRLPYIGMLIAKQCSHEAFVYFATVSLLNYTANIFLDVLKPAIDIFRNQNTLWILFLSKITQP